MPRLKAILQDVKYILVIRMQMYRNINNKQSQIVHYMLHHTRAQLILGSKSQRCYWAFSARGISVIEEIILRDSRLCRETTEWLRHTTLFAMTKEK